MPWPKRVWKGQEMPEWIAGVVSLEKGSAGGYRTTLSSTITNFPIDQTITQSYPFSRSAYGVTGEL